MVKCRTGELSINHSVQRPNQCSTEPPSIKEDVRDVTYYSKLVNSAMHQCNLDEFVGKVSSLQNADETRNVVVAMFLIAESVQHHQTNGVDVTQFTVGQQATHFLQLHIQVCNEIIISHIFSSVPVLDRPGSVVMRWSVRRAWLKKVKRSNTCYSAPSRHYHRRGA